MPVNTDTFSEDFDGTLRCITNHFNYHKGSENFPPLRLHYELGLTILDFCCTFVKKCSSCCGQTRLACMVSKFMRNIVLLLNRHFTITLYYNIRDMFFFRLHECSSVVYFNSTEKKNFVLHNISLCICNTTQRSFEKYIKVFDVSKIP